jgi:Carbohydrate family 9 binding domain-like
MPAIRAAYGLVVLAFAMLGAGEIPAPKGYVCSRAIEAIKIDGRLDEKSWARVPWTDTFVDIEGDARPLPRFKTRVKMLWDDSYFYIAAEMEEPDVWGTLTKHDAVIFHDNDFEVFIDPDGDNHEYYEFEINVLNTGWDLFLKKPYRDGGPAENGWEIPGLKTAVHIDGTLNQPGDQDKGWSVEIAIPWSVLAEYAHKACPPTDGDQWRVNFSRVEWQIKPGGAKYEKVPGTKEDNWVWSPQGVVDMHRPERWGYVQFSRGEPGKVAFRPDPTQAARDRLSRVYDAQKDYRKKTMRWASSLEELAIDPSIRPPIRLNATTDGFEARLAVAVGPNEIREVTIGSDSRFKVTPIAPMKQRP